MPEKYAVPTLSIDLDKKQQTALKEALKFIPETWKDEAKTTARCSITYALDHGVFEFSAHSRPRWAKRLETLGDAMYAEAEKAEKKRLTERARLVYRLGSRVAATSLIMETDLRPITRDADLYETRVLIAGDEYDELRGVSEEYEPRTPWLKFGRAELRMPEREGRPAVLQARVTYGVTDQEHDSCWAICLPLIDVKMEGVSNGRTCITACIAPRGRSEFKVPWPGYDPTKHPDAFTCKECKPRHKVAPEGYVPYTDAHLYQHVQGRRVSISLGSVEEKERRRR
jgi:hypothetical protein